ncbi:MAG: hypothetical protein K5657_05590 [Desulfovibrio sp.]|nr:hypothetical protein [Desulfovibrio sp.]
MGFLSAVRDTAVSGVLQRLRSFLSENYLAGIGTITDLRYESGRLSMRISLLGLEDREIEAVCSRVSIAPDGSSITLSDFTSNMPFMATILNRYLASAPLTLPEGNVRTFALTAKKVLGV